MRKVIKALVLAGDGINCEIETAYVAREAGFDTRIIHVNDLLTAEGAPLSEASLLVLPGGFSFGDELGSGKILALKLRHGLGKVLETFIARRNAVLGICNGFQVLTRLGVFGNGVVLTQNEGGHFMNRWVGLELTGRCIFTERLRKAGVTRLELPIRHGEGRLVMASAETHSSAHSQSETHSSAHSQSETHSSAHGVQTLATATVVMRYDEDVNGSWDRVAGLSACDGRILGLMPHPEAFWTEELHPWGPGRRVPLGVELFKSALDELGGRA